MFRKKTVIILSLFSSVFAFLMLWNYALYLEDRHPLAKETVQSDLSQPPQNDSTDVITKKGYYLYVNLDELQLYVYKDASLVKTYPVSGGSPKTPSPTGNWLIVSKDTWGEGFGGAWMGFNVPWGKYGFHGTIEPWFVGKSNSSQGCIRMKNKDVLELYKMIPQGTPVTITHKNRVFRALKNGDIGSDVLEMQRMLKKLGYYQGGTDGKFGSHLDAAVKKFQKENKLYSTGVVNITTYNKVLEYYKTAAKNTW